MGILKYGKVNVSTFMFHVTGQPCMLIYLIIGLLVPYIYLAELTSLISPARMDGDLVRTESQSRYCL